MRTVIPCDSCDGVLEAVPGRGLVCSNRCEGDSAQIVCEDRHFTPGRPLAPLRALEPIAAQIDNRPRWQPCGCVRTPENYVTRTSAGVTYSGCRDCWEGVAS